MLIAFIKNLCYNKIQNLAKSGGTMMKAIKLIARADIKGITTDEGLKALDGYSESEWKTFETDDGGIISFDKIDAFIDEFIDKNPHMKSWPKEIIERDV